jgi:hypothetical protein
VRAFSTQSVEFPTIFEIGCEGIRYRRELQVTPNPTLSGKPFEYVS